ncbi:MAG TPA: hypothetical protein VGR02_09040 [Thermoanaerobaculia bacterium]|jgi:hypothetical protein|nr:hypothetical protein [Thermoanaerobaculia bacterium]
MAHAKPKSEQPRIPPAAQRCRRKFLRFFPEGFHDETYIDWERGYKAAAHDAWESALGRFELRSLMKKGDFGEIASRAARIEGKTNLLFSFEKMALRDAVKSPEGAEAFAKGLYAFLHGKGSDRQRFEQWIETVAALPRRQTRVLTWPLVTVFGFLAQPEKHIFLKPNVTRIAAREYGFDFHYRSGPNWETYANLLQFAETVRNDNADLRPRDLIDVQSFLWVQGSDEYEE